MPCNASNFYGVGPYYAFCVLEFIHEQTASTNGEMIIVKDKCVMNDTTIEMNEMFPWSLRLAVAVILIVQGIMICCCSCYLMSMSKKSAKKDAKLTLLEVGSRSKASQSQCTYDRKLSISRFRVLPDALQG